jgi:WD40 repeat protein
MDYFFALGWLMGYLKLIKLKLMRIILSLFILSSYIPIITIAQTTNVAEKPQLIVDPQGHSGVVNALQFSKDGNTLISVGNDKTIRFWDIQDGSLIKTLRTQSNKGPDGAIYTTTLSPDGSYLALGGYFPENEIRIINLQRQQDVVILKGHKNVINKLVFSKNGRILASASADRTVKIWGLTYNAGAIQGELLRSLNGHQGQIYDIDISPSGTSVISAAADGTLRLWQLDEDIEPVVMQMHIDKVYSCAFSPDGNYIVSGGNKGKIIVWNRNGSFNAIIGNMDSPVGQLNFTSDNKLFASARDIKIFTVPSGVLIGTIPEQEKNVNAASIYKNKYFATSASATGKIIVRDIQNQITLSEVRGNGILPLEVASDNSGVVAIGNKSGTLTSAFDFMNLKFLFSNFNKQSFSDEKLTENGYTLSKTDPYTLSTGFKGLVINNPRIDGRILKYTIIDNDNIAVGSDYSIKVYSREGTLKREFRGAGGAVTSMAVDHQYNYLITSTQDQTVRIWNIETGENIASLFVGADNDWIVWTKNGYYSASAGGEKYLGWHINKGINKHPGFYPANVFAENFHQDEIVKQAFLLGSEEAALASVEIEKKDAVKKEINFTSDVPVVSWVSPELVESETDKRRITIKATIDSSSPIKMVKILINGRPAPQARAVKPSDNKMLVEQDILLLNEVNKIKIFVSNENARTVSEERTIKIPKELLANQKAISTQVIDYTAKPDLYVLGIGISDYANSDYNLTYADDDAQSITDLFSTTGKHAYKDVNTIKLLNADATKEKILSAFASLYQNTTSKDIVVITIAAHGFNKDGEFYVLPYDGDAERLVETGIGWRNLSNTLGNLPPRVLLMVDACYSGQLGTNIEHLESDNTEAVRQIVSEENGVVIMAASTGDETSLEFADWGHGAFTLSVLEALAEEKANIKDDLTIFLRELDFYVYERTVELTQDQQHPTTQKPSSISRFPVLIIDK